MDRLPMYYTRRDSRVRNFKSNAEFGVLSRCYSCTSSVEHHQLRDLLSYTEDSSGNPFLLTVQGNTTVAFDIEAETKPAVVVQPLAYGPTAMTVADGFIASAGIGGQVDVKSLDGEISVKGPTHGTVNNALHIWSPRPEEPLLFVANNNCTIKVRSILDISSEQTIEVETPINYQTMDPFGRRLAATGDNAKLFQFEPSESRWQQTSCWASGATEAGMCCSWAPGGTSLGVVFQDGRCSFWDPRSQQRTSELRMTEPVRNIKFSESPTDLVAVAEHKGFVHIVDVRNTSAVQTIRLEPADQIQHKISGLTWSPQGKRLYVAQEGGGIVCIETDTLSRKVFSSGTLC